MSPAKLAVPLLAAAIAIAAASPAAAFRMIPIEMEFTPSGRGATQILRLENDRAEPAAVEVRVMARTMLPDGSDQLIPADDQFAVYPEQLVLMPGQNQSVRVQWLGDTAPRQELAFRLIAEQMPVDLGQPPPQGGQVRLLVRYVASAYVVPPGVRPKIVVESAASRATPEGKKLELVLANQGTAHQILRDTTLTLQAGGRSLTLEPEQLAGLEGENLLAGASRRFVLPWPAGLPEGSLAVTFAQSQ